MADDDYGDHVSDVLSEQWSGFLEMERAVMVFCDGLGVDRSWANDDLSSKEIPIPRHSSILRACSRKVSSVCRRKAT